MYYLQFVFKKWYTLISFEKHICENLINVKKKRNVLLCAVILLVIFLIVLLLLVLILFLLSSFFNKKILIRNLLHKYIYKFTFFKQFYIFLLAIVFDKFVLLDTSNSLIIKSAVKCLIKWDLYCYGCELLYFIHSI